VILRTPNWQDFVHLVFFEIRRYGAENIQIARRLRAMTENLVQTLPDRRHAALRQQLELLDRALETLYAFPEDLALARIAEEDGADGRWFQRAMTKLDAFDRRSRLLACRIAEARRTSPSTGCT
jgi:hypothetical protein